MTFIVDVLSWSRGRSAPSCRVPPTPSHAACPLPRLGNEPSAIGSWISVLCTQYSVLTSRQSRLSLRPRVFFRGTRRGPSAGRVTTSSSRHTPCAVRQLRHTPCAVRQLTHTPCAVRQVTHTPCAVRQLRHTPCAVRQLRHTECACYFGNAKVMVRPALNCAKELGRG